MYVDSANKRVGIGITSPNKLLYLYDTTNRLTITDKGNVGIGTTRPGQKLDVNGAIHATGDICTDKLGGECLSGYRRYGLYGYCTESGDYEQNCSSNSAYPPAYCSRYGHCSCPAGFTLVRTGTYGGDTIYSCYKE